MCVWLPAWLPKRQESPLPGWQRASDLGALGGTRTPNLLIRSQMLYPLSYERRLPQYMAVDGLTVRVQAACSGHGGDRASDFLIRNSLNPYQLRWTTPEPDLASRPA